ncbi:MAG: AsnC family transcriptional regulator [Asgard group archaeon]|nr:AsnC family transcriptional regulator [Asgard group archaeon]
MLLLDAKDLEILFALQDEPLATISSIAERVKMSVSGAKLRLERLETKQKAFKRINVHLNLNALDLDLVDFFVKINKKSALEVFENKICYYHPYVSYRARIFGQFSGLYIQFRIPKGTLDNLILLFDKLQSQGFLEYYEFIPRNKLEIPVYIKSSYKSWDVNQQQWIFDWKKWSKGFEHISNASISKSNSNELILNQLTEFDVKLLEEIMFDARKKNVDFIKKMDLDANPSTTQKISRRLTYLKDNAISGYRLFLNPEYFGLYQTVIIKASCSKGIARKLRNYLLLGNGEQIKEIEYNDKIILLTFPFQSVYFITDEGFLWYVRAPQAHISELINFVWGICPQHNVFWTIYKSSLTYALWHKTFEVESHQWKTSKEFMINSVMDNL